MDAVGVLGVEPLADECVGAERRAEGLDVAFAAAHRERIGQRRDPSERVTQRPAQTVVVTDRVGRRGAEPGPVRHKAPGVDRVEEHPVAALEDVLVAEPVPERRTRHPERLGLQVRLSYPGVPR